MNFKHTIAFLCILLLQSYTATYCAEAPRALRFLDQAVSAVEQATRLPRVLANIVMEYDEEGRFKLKKKFPAQYVPGQQAVLACGLLAHVTRTGVLTTTNLVTNKVEKTLELFTSAKRKKHWIEDAITALPNGLLAIPVRHSARDSIETIKILDITADTCVKIPADSSASKLRYLVLPDDELVAYPSGRSPQEVFDIHTGKEKRRMDYAYGKGCLDLVHLGDNRVAAGCTLPYGPGRNARRQRIVVSDLQAPLEGKYNLHHANPKVGFFTVDTVDDDMQITGLAPLGDDKLVVASEKPSVFGHVASLDILDAKTLEHLWYFTFPDERNITIVPLAHAVGVKKNSSEELGIVYFNDDNEPVFAELPGDSKPKTIQGVANGDLFVEYPDGKGALFGESPDMSFYEQAGRKHKKKKTWVV